MKKRLISLLLCLVLCVSLLPMAALAEEIEPLAVEEGEVVPEPTAEPVEEPEPTAEPEVATEPMDTPEQTVETEPEPDPVAQVQALLDALPDAETVTADTRAAVEAQLTAIDDARLALDDDSTLDYTRYAAVVAALEALDGTPDASEPELLGNSDYNELQGLIDAAGPSKIVTLDKDYSINQTLTINTRALTLDLNGYTLTGTMNGPVIEVLNNCTISNSRSPAIESKITNTKTQTTGLAAGVVIRSGVFTLKNVTIYGCETSKANTAGGIYVAAGGALNMEGTISHCKSSGENSAGGVYFASNEIGGSYLDGKISNCSSTGANSAGGVYIASGSTVRLRNAIQNCWASGANSAGGAYVAGTLFMGTYDNVNGEIVNCDSGVAATGSAGGVYLTATGSVTGFSGGTLAIRGCTSKCGGSAGGIYVAGGTHSLNVNITECKGQLTSESTCTDEGSAAAIYLAGHANVTMSGTISRCVYVQDKKGTEAVSGGVYVPSGTTFTMNGDSKIEFCRVECPYNEAPEKVAGGVYNEGSFTTSGAVTGCNIWYWNGAELKTDSRVSAGIMNCGTLMLKSGASIEYSSAVPMTVDGDNYTLISKEARTLDLVNGYKTNYNAFAPNCNVTPEGGRVVALVNYGTIGETTSAAPTKFSSGTNYGTIQAANFNDSSGKLDNYGTISGGTYDCKVECSDYSYVTGGDFSGASCVNNRPHSLQFVTLGGSPTPATQWRWNATFTKPAPEPARSAYHFVGWYTYDTDNERIVEESPYGDEYFAVSHGIATESEVSANTVVGAKWEALLATKPAAKTGLTYNGAAQELITAGALSSYAETNGYTLEYKLSTASAYNATPPTATDAGDHTVQYRVRKGNDVADSGTIRVTIGQADLAAAVSMTGYTYGTAAPTPTLTGNSGGGTVTYYYSANSDKSAAKSWPGDTALEAGTYYLFAKIAQTKNYKACETAAVPFTVTPARPEANGALTASVYVNDTLQVGDVKGSMTVAGSFAITGVKTWTSSGSKTTTVTFTPSDAKNYQSVENISVDVTVSKRTVASVTSTLSAVTDKDYGTAQTALGLPDKVSIQTADGKAFENIPVAWSGYDPNTLNAQTLTGALDLSGISEEVAQAETPVTASISVTLKALIASAPKYDPKTTAYTGEPIGHELGSITGVQSVKYEYEGRDGTSYAKSETAPTDAGSYAVTASFTMEAGYAPLAAASSTLTITARSVTPRVTIAAGTHTYDGSEHKPAVTLKDGDVTIPAGEYTVSYSNNINAGTASVTITDNANGNYSFTNVKGSNTFEIEKRPVMLKSADAGKEYDGTALVDTDKIVTASGMAAGETFAYDFTGAQTDIGASDNAFTARDNGKAKVANYDITYDYGTLRVTLPEAVGDATEGMTVDSVTSDDRKTIEDTLKTVEDYLGMEPTKDEATKLNELEDKLHELLDKLDEARNAAGDKTIGKTDDITKDNAKPSDKKKLEDAKDAIEKALEDFGANLTEEEKQQLNDKLDRINAALDAIAAAEAAAKAVRTGDEAMPLLWLALALSAAITLGYTARKKES